MVKEMDLKSIGPCPRRFDPDTSRDDDDDLITPPCTTLHANPYTSSHPRLSSSRSGMPDMGGGFPGGAPDMGGGDAPPPAEADEGPKIEEID